MNNSPVSGNTLTSFLTATDNLVSRETFQLLLDQEWDMLLTDPVPKNLSEYYKSENYQPHQHQKKTLFNRVYNYIRNRGFMYKYKLIKTFHPQAKSVLDYGTATGEFLQFLQQKTLSVSGVEPNKNARELANDLLKNKVAVSIDKIDKKVDVITLWHVLEHIENIDEIILKLQQKLNPEGVLFIAVPNFKSYDAKHYGKHWAAYDVPRHLWHFSPKAINRLFTKHNMKVIAQKPLYYDSYYVSLLSEQNKNGRKCLIKAFYNGYISNRKAKKSGNYSSLIYVIGHK